MVIDNTQIKRLEFSKRKADGGEHPKPPSDFPRTTKINFVGGAGHTFPIS